jgi:hypothetical protein
VVLGRNRLAYVNSLLSTEDFLALAAFLLLLSLDLKKLSLRVLRSILSSVVLLLLCLDPHLAP